MAADGLASTLDLSHLRNKGREGKEKEEHLDPAGQKSVLLLEDYSQARDRGGKAQNVINQSINPGQLGWYEEEELEVSSAVFGWIESYHRRPRGKDTERSVWKSLLRRRESGRDYENTTGSVPNEFQLFEDIFSNRYEGELACLSMCVLACCSVSCNRKKRLQSKPCGRTPGNFIPNEIKSFISFNATTVPMWSCL